MKARFLACAACHRHVKEGDAACPFCGTAAPRAGAAQPAQRVRMTRAAMIAAGTAGTVAVILDCGGQTAGEPGGTEVFYGVACTGSECIGTSQEAAPSLFPDAEPSPFGEGSSAVFYGVVCTGDACGPTTVEEDATGVDASDATSGSDAGDE